jgi:hypothetical protein
MTGPTATALWTVLLGAPLVALLTLLFGRPLARAQTVKTEREAEKTDVDADTARMAAVFAAVEPLHRIIATLDKRISDGQVAEQRTTDRLIAMQIRLDTADEKIGVLERREREYLLYVPAAQATIDAQAKVIEQLGGEPLPAPVPPAARAERTRRTDHD